MGIATPKYRERHSDNSQKPTSTVDTQIRNAPNELGAKVTTPLTVSIGEDRLHLHLVTKLTLTDRRYTITTYHLP